MILAAFLAATAFSSANDYSPLVPGTKWTYENDSSLQFVEEIGQPVDIGKNQTAFPKVRKIAGKSGGAELYRTEGDTLFLVGGIDNSVKPPASPITLLNEPQPVLRVAEGKAQWKYVGELTTGMGPILVRVQGDSHKGPRKNVLGRDVDTLIVHVESQIGNDRGRVVIKTDAIYGKGIGLVELNEATKAQGETVKKVLKLVKFEPPQG
jgi:hypothetical protein